MAASTGWSFISFIFGTLRKFVEKLQVWFKYENNVGHFTRRPTFFYVVDSRTRYCVAPQQCKGNPNVACRGFILLTATCMSISVQREAIVTFLWQQCTIILRYAYVA